MGAGTVVAGVVVVGGLGGLGYWWWKRKQDTLLRSRQSEAARLQEEAAQTAKAAQAAALTEAAGPPPLTRARHRAALQTAADRLAAACSATYPELRAEDLRLALRAIGRITGRVGVEDILDSVFRQFCIGK